MTSYICRDPRMELLGLKATSGWNPRRCWPTPDGINPAVIYTCCWFHLAIPWWSLKRSWTTLESTEKLGYLGLHTHCINLHAAVSIGLPPDGIYTGDRLPRMKPIEELGYPGWIQTATMCTCFCFHWAGPRWIL
jgi:hypothetical protein